MKVGKAKAYRVAAPAVECLKAETNIVDAKVDEIFTIVSCLTRDAWKASRRGDPRRQVKRLDIPDPWRVGGNRMKVGKAKAYRVAAPAVEYLKAETNIVDAKV